jgi:hypothetical protein
LPGLSQGVHRFIGGQEDYRFERAKRATATNRQRNGVIASVLMAAALTGRLSTHPMAAYATDRETNPKPTQNKK